MKFSLLRHALIALIVGTLAACSTPPPPPPPSKPLFPPAPVAPPAPEKTRIPPVSGQPVSRWVAARWEDLPGFSDDRLHEAWNAWVRSCERPPAAFARLCPEVRRLSIGTAPEQRAWMLQHLQPYRIETTSGTQDGLLTGYYEPQLKATRQQRAGYNVPLYSVPTGLTPRQPWFTRQEIETLPQAQAALQGRAIAWLADPVDAMVLHIQGSGRLNITEPDGSVRLVRVAFAATNEQPYKSIGRWLLDQNLVRDATWPGISAWIAANPSASTSCCGATRATSSFAKSRWPSWTRNLAPKARKA